MRRGRPGNSSAANFSTERLEEPPVQIHSSSFLPSVIRNTDSDPWGSIAANSNGGFSKTEESFASSPYDPFSQFATSVSPEIAPRRNSVEMYATQLEGFNDDFSMPSGNHQSFAQIKPQTLSFPTISPQSSISPNHSSTSSAHFQQNSGLQGISPNQTRIPPPKPPRRKSQRSSGIQPKYDIGQNQSCNTAYPGAAQAPGAFSGMPGQRLDANAGWIEASTTINTMPADNSQKINTADKFLANLFSKPSNT